MLTFKQSICPICKTGHITETSQDSQTFGESCHRRETVLAVGVSIITEKLGRCSSSTLLSTSTLSTWMESCEACFSHVAELVALQTLLKETENKIGEKLKWISAKIGVETVINDDNNEEEDGRLNARPLTEEEEGYLMDIELKSEPPDEEDVNHDVDLDVDPDPEGGSWSEVNFEMEDVNSVPSPRVPSPNKGPHLEETTSVFANDVNLPDKRTRKRKVPFDDQGTFGESKKEKVPEESHPKTERLRKSRTLEQDSKGQFQQIQVHIQMKSKSTPLTLEDPVTLILNDFPNSKPEMKSTKRAKLKLSSKNLENCPELRITLQDLASLLPSRDRKRLGPLVDCRFRLQQLQEEGNKPDKAATGAKVKVDTGKLKEIVSDQDDDVEGGNRSDDANDDDFIPPNDKDSDSESDVEIGDEGSDWSLEADTDSKPRTKTKTSDRVIRRRRSKKSDPNFVSKKDRLKNRARKNPIPELDFKCLTSLTVVNGRKYFLQHEFKEDDNSGLSCGFPDCDFIVGKDTNESSSCDKDNRMMDHINEKHFPELEAKIRPRKRHLLECPTCATIDPSNPVRLSVKDYRRHLKELHQLSTDPTLLAHALHCPFCSMPIYFKNWLYDHVWIHYTPLQAEALVAQGFRDPRKRLEKLRAKFKRDHPCPISGCERIFLSKQGLDGHTLLCHSDRVDKSKRLSKRDKTVQNRDVSGQEKSFRNRPRKVPVPELDFKDLDSLIVVEGRKYFLHYEFKKENDNSGLSCGFPNCDFMIGKDTTCEGEMDSNMMDHIKEKHFPELVAKAPPGIRNLLECTLCSTLDPDNPIVLKYHAYRKHLQDVHPTHLTTDPTLLAHTLFCPTCSAPFGSRDSLLAHAWIHYNAHEAAALVAQGFTDPRARLRDARDLVQVTFRHICTHPSCSNRSFKGKAALDAHTATHTSVADRPKLLCDICGLAVTTARGLTLHRARHNPDDLFGKWKICPICPKRFLLLPQLTRHMTGVHGTYDERPWICEVCGFRSPSKHDLQKHSRSHNPKEWRPHRCDLCGETYRYPTSLKRHVEARHGSERVVKGVGRKVIDLGDVGGPVQGPRQMWPCERSGCGRIFDLRSRLRKHLETKHGNDEESDEDDDEDEEESEYDDVEIEEDKIF